MIEYSKVITNIVCIYEQGKGREFVFFSDEMKALSREGEMRRFLLFMLVFISLLLIFGCENGSDNPNPEAFPSWYYNPFGFASLSISDRSEEES
jgi:hypothetical protein